MAQTSMDLFEKKRLNDTGMVEQVRKSPFLGVLSRSKADRCRSSDSTSPPELRDGRHSRGQDAKELGGGHDPPLGRERVCRHVRLSPFLLDDYLRGGSAERILPFPSRLKTAVWTRSGSLPYTSCTRTACRTRTAGGCSSTQSSTWPNRMLSITSSSLARRSSR